MNNKTKFILIALLAIVAVSIFINFLTYVSKKSLEEERNGLIEAKEALTIKIGEITKENIQLQDRIASLKRDLDVAVKEKEEIQKNYELANKAKDKLGLQLKLLNSQLAEEENQKRQIQDTLNLEKRKNRLLMQQLKVLDERKVLLEKKLELLSVENISGADFVSGQPEELAGGQEAQETVKPGEDGSVELPPIVVYSQPKVFSRKPEEMAGVSAVVIKEPSLIDGKGQDVSRATEIPIEGKVLGVNRENNFVVIDLGEDSGVKLGDTFSVYKKDKAVANIEVIQTRKRVAACDIRKEINRIEAGDVVK